MKMGAEYREWVCSSAMTREWGLSCLCIGPSAPGFERTVAEPKNRTSQILSKRLIIENKRIRNKNILLIKIYNVCMSPFYGAIHIRLETRT
jgi:hypothetical protein